MKTSTVNIEDLNLGSILWVTLEDGQRIIGEVNGLSRCENGYNVSMKRYGSRNDFVKFIDINPVYVTDEFLTANFDKDDKSDMWSAMLGDYIHMDIVKSADKRYGNYVIDLFDNDLHTFCSIDFLQVHQLQNILHYFNVKYKPDVSSYTDKK